MRDNRMASTGKKKLDAKPSQRQKSISSFFTTKQDLRGDAAGQGKRSEFPGSRSAKPQGSLAVTSAAEEANTKTVAPEGQADKLAKSVDGKLPGTASAASPAHPPKRTKVEQKSAKAEAAAAPDGERPDEDLTGRRVRIYWPAEQAWYSGSITARGAGGKHHVNYDDGDTEWLALSEERWEMLQGGSADGEGRRQSAPAGKKRRRAQLVESTSESEPASESEGSGEDSDFSARAAGGAASSSSEDDVSVDEEADEGAGSPAAPKAKQARGKIAASSAARRQPGPQRPGSGRKRPPSDQLTEGPSAKPGASDANGNELTHKVSVPFPSTTVSGAGAAQQSSAALMTNDAERYAARAAERFPFLHPDRLRDGKGRRPGEAGYDSRTLRIPADWFKAAKVSEGQRQWWEFKAQHFDSVLLFKMGKFYEMFEMDAHTGAEILGLLYMKGDQPHCGFPEANYHQHAERLARAGLRVVVIEQTETPEQLRVRNEQRRAHGKPKATVVNREMVAVLTRGTLTDPEMLRSHADAAYVLALTEAAPAEPAGGPCLGACAVDCATGRMLVDGWCDDEARTALRAHLAALRPVEVVLPALGLASTTEKVLLASLRCPRINRLEPGREFWDARATAAELATAQYFGGDAGDRQRWPAVLQELSTECPDGEAALSAFGGAVSFLRSVLLDRSVLGLGRIERLTSCSGSGREQGASASETGPQHIAMDGSALENLEVLETADGGTAGTVLAALDACSTPAGRRRLKEWLCRPLARIAEIRARQDAVAALSAGAAGPVAAARKAMAGIGDLERSIARLCASSLGGFGRDSASVVLYEDAAKRKLSAFLAALRGLQTLQGVFASLRDIAGASSLLRDLTSLGRRLPDFAAPLRQLLDSADWDSAAAQGRIVPNKGVDAAFDGAMSALDDAEAGLQGYLRSVRRTLRTQQGVCLVSHFKESHVLEVEQDVTAPIPGHFELVSQKKGSKRFTTPELRQLQRAWAEAQQGREAAMAGILQGLVARFAESQGAWNGAVAAMAEVDALMSLAAAGEQAAAWGPVCRPTFVDAGVTGQQVFRAVALRHPAAAAHSGDFVPNDVQLGSPAFTVITGPNMGGKSTLMRQVCLAALLAHVGALVPAQSLELSPVDAIFVRMGARDSILTGQSTFFVELTETAAALNRATAASLVALDELGRGTSTADGAAIAAAVLEHLAGRVRCRGLFATHYHRLADSHADDPNIAIRHMSCSVTRTPDGQEQVAFLYKLAEGACPKSYGTNVASLAGIPGDVVSRAAQYAEKLDARRTARQTPLSAAERLKLRRLRALLNSASSSTDIMAELRAVSGCI